MTDSSANIRTLLALQEDGETATAQLIGAYEELDSLRRSVVAASELDPAMHPASNLPWVHGLAIEMEKHDLMVEDVRDGFIAGDRQGAAAAKTTSSTFLDGYMEGEGTDFDIDDFGSGSEGLEGALEHDDSDDSLMSLREREFRALNLGLNDEQIEAVGGLPPTVREAVLEGDFDGEVAFEIISGDHGQKAQEELEQGNFEAAFIETLDDETAANFVINNYFAATFGVAAIERDGQRGDEYTVENSDEVLALVASGANETEIKQRLRDAGVPPEELAATYQRIEGAAQVFVGNEAVLGRLDDSDASYDQSGDLATTRYDVEAGLMNKTSATGSRSEQIIREQVLVNHADRQSPSDPGMATAVFAGDSHLGTLAGEEQTLFVARYVDGVAAYHMDFSNPNMSQGGTDRAALPVITDDGAFGDALRQQYALKAVELELGGPEDPMAQAFAASFAVEVLVDQTPEQQAEIVGDLDQTIVVNGPLGPTEVSQAGVFGEALLIPTDMENATDRYLGRDGRRGHIVRHNYVTTIVGELNDGAGKGGRFNSPEEAFVMATFSNMPADGYRQDDAFSNQPDSEETWELAEIYGRALAIVGHPDDAAAQTRHRQRLSDLLKTDPAQLLFGDNPHIDEATQSQLNAALILGRSDGEQWIAEDFEDPTLEIVIADVTVDLASDQREALGGALSNAEEQTLRDLIATEDGRELFGFGEYSDHTRRSMFSHITFEQDWTPDDITTEGSVWENSEVNAEYLLLLAQINSGFTLEEEQLGQLREIAESEGGRHVIGLDKDLSDSQRLEFLDMSLQRGWTSETFAAADDPMLNVIFNQSFAEDHIDRYNEGGELDLLLSEFIQSGPGGGSVDVEGYVQTALAPDGELDLSDDPTFGDIVAEINTRRGSDETITAIPIQVDTGGGQRLDTVLFGIVGPNGNVRGVIDQNGKFYDGIDDWQQESFLPPGRVTFPLTEDADGVEHFARPGSEGEIQGTRTTRAYPDTWWENHGDKVQIGLTVGGSLVMFVNPLLGGAMVVAGGGLEVYESTGTLRSHRDHGGNMGFSDPTARQGYLQLGDGLMTIAGGGFSGRATRLAGVARSGEGATGRFAATAMWFNRVDSVYEVGSNGQEIVSILNSDMTAAEQLKALAIMGVTQGAPGLVRNSAIRYNTWRETPRVGRGHDGEVMISHSPGPRWRRGDQPDAAGQTQPPTPESVTFTPGRPVTVRRTNGAVESDWQIRGVAADGTIDVWQPSTGVSKSYTPELLLQENPLLTRDWTLPVGTRVRTERGADASLEVVGYAADGQILIRHRDGQVLKPYDPAEVVELNPHLLAGFPPVRLPEGADGFSGGWRVQRVRPDGRVELSDGSTTRALPVASILKHNPNMLNPESLEGSNVGLARPITYSESDVIFEIAQPPSSPDGRPMGVAEVTPEFLRDSGLEPAFMLANNGQQLYVSVPYEIAGRRAVVAYVPDGNGAITERTFYLSSSHGVWRSASHGLPPDAHNPVWFGKGLGQESTNLPIGLQRQLYGLLDSGEVLRLDENVRNRAFYGALERIPSIDPPVAFSDAVAAPEHIGELTGTMPDFDGQNPGRSIHGNPQVLDPRTFEFDNPEHAPNFGDAPTQTYKLEHPIHGPLKAQTFYSLDGSLEYQFLQDPNGRTWIGQIDRVDGRPTNWGVNNTSFETSILTQPGIDYHKELKDHGFAFIGDHIDGPYYGAERFTHNLPPVADYLAWQRGAEGEQPAGTDFPPPPGPTDPPHGSPQPGPPEPGPPEPGPPEPGPPEFPLGARAIASNLEHEVFLDNGGNLN